MPFAEHAASFAFTSDRFDHSSDLPPDANAGNRLYGRDVADFVAAGLGDQGLDASFFDEDWGWQVHAARDDGTVLEVSIQHDSGDDWQLMLRALRKERRLGIVRAREVPIDDSTLALLGAVFRQAGVELRQSQ
jgi:hypothetical protein